MPVGLALALVAMFAFGIYWLATKDRPMWPSASSPAVPPAASRSASAPRDIDDCESGAPYPDHILKAVRDIEPEQRRASSLPGTHREATRPDRSRNVRAELHEATNALIDEPSPTSSTTESTSDAAPHCSNCHSSRVDTSSRARKAGSAIGSILGATGGIAVALAGAEAGAVTGIVAGPVGPVFGSVAGAVIATLCGSAAGSAIGSAVGNVIDSKVGPRYQCRACGHTFSMSNQWRPVPWHCRACNPSNPSLNARTAATAVPSAQPRADIPLPWSQSMLPISPLEYLAAFALAFLGGVLVAACHCRYVGKVRRDAWTRAYEVPVHA